jgi:hypothetical protein
MSGKDDRTQGPRLIPKVTFGISAAVLAGVFVVAVAPGPSAALAGSERVLTTASLVAVINGTGGDIPSTNETACCA